MKVWADIRQEVQVNPVEVIEKLITNEIGDGWIREKLGKYYLVTEESAGRHSFEMEKEISEDRYQYVNSLNRVVKYLKTKEEENRRKNS